MATAQAQPLPARSKPKSKERSYDLSVLALLLPATLVVVVLFVYPFVYGLMLSFMPQEGGISISNYVKFLQDSYQRESLFNTLRLAVPNTLVVLCTAVPAAYVMRRGMWGESLITTLLILPISLGAVLTSEGIIGYFGPGGWFNQILESLGIIKEPLRLTHNWTGVMIAMYFKEFAFCFLMLLGYVSGINPNIEYSARVLGASPLEVLRRVMLPLMAPGIAIATCLTFVTNFSVFPSAMLVGEPAGATRSIAIAAYQMAFEHYDFSMATSIAMIMGFVELAVVVMILGLRERLYKGSAISGAKG